MPGGRAIVGTVASVARGARVAEHSSLEREFDKHWEVPWM